jgi:hypothetical protein
MSVLAEVENRSVAIRMEKSLCGPVRVELAGTDCGLDPGWAAQQLIVPPLWQQAQAGCRAQAGLVCAKSMGAAISARMQMMVHTDFMI